MKKIIYLFTLLFFFNSVVQSEIYMYKNKKNTIFLTNTLEKNTYSKYISNYKKYKIVYVSPSRLIELKNKLLQIKKLDPVEKNQLMYDEEILTASIKYKIEFELIKAIIRAGSNFDENYNHKYTVANKKIAFQGLMSVPEYISKKSKKDVYSPMENILMGTDYLKHLMEHYDFDLELVLAAYISTQKNLDELFNKTGQVFRYSYIKKFVNNVLIYYKEYLKERKGSIKTLNLSQNRVKLFNIRMRNSKKK